ncbi:MAG TPA: hypothetical protein VFB27_09765 [Opitutaceae bacterium]|nr:hypothetical protein [Opitutaceae bacterium]
MAGSVLRILSDLHLDDRGCRVRELKQLLPLFEGVETVVFNGDSLDTRPGPAHLPAAKLAAMNAANLERRAAFFDFLGRHAPPGTVLTGNHDPDISSQHALDLARGKVFVTHGDVFFDDIVPWSRDIAFIRAQVAREFATLSPARRADLPHRLMVFRRICARVPQRKHHTGCHPVRYVLGVMADVAWPTRTFAVLRAWREAPRRATALLLAHRPHARFLIMGHTHRHGFARPPGGLVVINTGSFCTPARPCTVDLSPDRLTLRRVVARHGAFHAGPPVATFALAPDRATEKITS